MASWHETYAPVREARRLWERTAPQLTIDFDELPPSGAASAPRSSPFTMAGQGGSNIGTGDRAHAAPGLQPSREDMESATCRGAFGGGRPGSVKPSTNGDNRG